MLVRLPETLTITEQFNLDRFNEIKLAAGERPVHLHPRERAGRRRLRRASARRSAAAPSPMTTASTSRTPPIDNLDGFAPYNTATAPRMGDTVTGLTGVLDYQWAGNSASGATWRVRAVEDGANTFESTPIRGPTAPEDVGGTLQVASFNVLNYFATLDDGVADRQRPGAARRQHRRGVRPPDRASWSTCIADARRRPARPGRAREQLQGRRCRATPSNTWSSSSTPSSARTSMTGSIPARSSSAATPSPVGFIYKTGVLQIAEGTTVEFLDDSDLPGLGLARPDDRQHRRHRLRRREHQPPGAGGDVRGDRDRRRVHRRHQPLQVEERRRHRRRRRPARRPGQLAAAARVRGRGADQVAGDRPDQVGRQRLSWCSATSTPTSRRMRSIS